MFSGKNRGSWKGFGLVSPTLKSPTLISPTKQGFVSFRLLFFLMVYVGFLVFEGSAIWQVMIGFGVQTFDSMDFK